MQTADAWKLRKLQTELEEFVDDSAHMVDYGVLLRVVERIDGPSHLQINGQSLRVIAEHRFGGMVDTRLPVPQFVGPSLNPVVWHASPQQARLILHDDSDPLRMLVYGAMGGGKTATLSKWIGLRVLELMGTNGDKAVQIGATAPTNDRALMIKQACMQDFPDSWYRWSERTSTFLFHNKVQVKCISTHMQNKAEGSRIQGWNWPACASDEIQDSIAADPDIEARGRAAPNGRYKRIATATAKDDPLWRTWADAVRVSPVWGTAHLEGMQNPFVDPRFWSDLRSTMSERDYKRRVLAMDIGPERMVYTSYDRSENLRPLPMIGSEDVTASVLSKYAINRPMLIGHDPGTIQDVTLLIKALRRNGSAMHDWWVIGEVVTEQSTTEAHIAELLKDLRRRGLHGVDHKGRPLEGVPTVFGRGDPYGDRENGTHKSVYTQFKNAGIDLRPATYKPGANTPGRVPKEAGIDMVNRLLCDANGVRRLFIAVGEDGRPLAPRLVHAIETSERDAEGKAETQAKNKHDVSHYLAALRYALWELERPRFSEVAIAGGMR